jgi:hypothetical protein
MDQVVVRLPSNHEALDSKPSTTKKGRGELKASLATQ